MSNRLGGLQGTAYLGTNANQPPNWSFNFRDPDMYDTQNVSVGDLWLNQNTEKAWVLLSLEGSPTSKGPLANWQPWAGPSGDVQTITGDDSVAVPPTNGNINLLGAHGINTSGVIATSTETVALNNAIALGDLTPLAVNAPALTVASGSILFSNNTATNWATTPQIQWTGSYARMSLNGTINLFYSDSVKQSVMIGAGTSDTPDIYNTACGYSSLRSIAGGSVRNTAVGALACQNGGAATVSDTTLVGYGTCGTSTTSLRNTAVGSYALTAVVTGTDNTALGYNAGSALTTNDSNNIHIGNPGFAGNNNAIYLGTAGTHNTCFVAGIRGVTTGNADAVAVLIDSNNQLGTVSSSLRYKENVNDMASYSERLMQLRPVTFNYKNDERKLISSGLIAEEVAELFPELVVYKDGEPETIKYHDIAVLLLNEVQKLVKRVAELESTL